MRYNSKKNKKLNRKRNRKYSKRKKISKKLNKTRNRQKSLFTKNKRIQKGGGKYKCAGDTWGHWPRESDMEQWTECPYDAYFFTPPRFRNDSDTEGWYTNKEHYPFAKGIKEWIGMFEYDAVREAGGGMTTLMLSVADEGSPNGTPVWKDPSNRQCPICYRRSKYREQYGSRGSDDGFDRLIYSMHREVLEVMYPRGGTAPQGDTNYSEIVGGNPSLFKVYNYCGIAGSGQDNVKFVTAHGIMLRSGERFNLPQNIRVITLVDVGRGLYGHTRENKDGLNHLKEIFNLYDKGSTLFGGNDTDPSNLTDEGREILDKFRSGFWWVDEKLLNPKLNLGGTSINNMALNFLDENCNMGMRYAGFCEIYCYNKSKDVRVFQSEGPNACGERCWNNYIPMPYLGDNGFITLKQLIERGNPDIPCLYIIYACRGTRGLNDTEVELLHQLSRNNSSRGYPRHRYH